MSFYCYSETGILNSAVPIEAPATHAESRLIAPAAEFDADPGTVFGLIDLILKNPKRLDQLLRESAVQREVVPRFLAIGLSSFAIFGVALTFVLTAAGVWPKLQPPAEWLNDSGRSFFQFAPDAAGYAGLGRWADGSVFKVIFTYAFGMIASIGVCLPGYYFYSLLAGLKPTMLEVAVHAMKGIATTALVLMGILPIYVAIMLGIAIFGAPAATQGLLLLIGLNLPFFGGLYSAKVMYDGFMRLADRIPEERRDDRVCLLQRMLLAWTANYMMVTPVMLYVLWEILGR